MKSYCFQWSQFWIGDTQPYALLTYIIVTSVNMTGNIHMNCIKLLASKLWTEQTICCIQQIYLTLAVQFLWLILPAVDKVWVNIWPSSGIHGPHIPPLPFIRQIGYVTKWWHNENPRSPFFTFVKCLVFFFRK